MRSNDLLEELQLLSLNAEPTTAFSSNSSSTQSAATSVRALSVNAYSSAAMLSRAAMTLPGALSSVFETN